MNSPFVDIYFHFQKFNLKWADFKGNELNELKKHDCAQNIHLKFFRILIQLSNVEYLKKALQRLKKILYQVIKKSAMKS